MTDAVNLSDTSTWLPLDGLAPGFDGRKAELSNALSGRTFTVIDDHGARTRHSFDQGTVTRSSAPAGGDGSVTEEETDECEVIEVADELFYVQFHPRSQRLEAVTLILDLASGHTLSVISTLGQAEPGRTAVQMSFTPGWIDGVEVRGSAPAPTQELIGRRVVWVYSDEHVYEHVYLSPHWYTWQCLAGPEQGLADTDANTVWQVRPGIYVFTWREKVIPCGSVTIADHRDQKAIRSHGVLFGWDESGTTPTHFTFGARGRLLSNTVHPAEFDPARALER